MRNSTTVPIWRIALLLCFISVGNACTFLVIGRFAAKDSILEDPWIDLGLGFAETAFFLGSFLGYRKARQCQLARQAVRRQQARVISGTEEAAETKEDATHAVASPQI